MKKTISIILALILALSCCTVLSVSAADDETQESAPVYLLGDTDLDGEVTVLDATLIQRVLADLTQMSGLQTELGNIFGEGLDISCATAIQRYLAGFEIGSPIGENIADENEGVVYSEIVPLYQSLGNNNITPMPMELFFSTAYPDVAFIADNEAVDSFANIYGYDPDGFKFSDNDGVHVYSFPTGTSVAFDPVNKWMIFDDYTTFTTVNGAMPFSCFGSSFPSSMNLYTATDKSRYFGGDPRAIQFDYATIPMLRHGDTILIPLQTCTDFFLSAKGVFIQYNGDGVFILNHTTEKTDPSYWKLYNDVEKVKTISPALAQVNYYELCATLEAHYGLRKAHDIEDFDTYFARKKLKADFLSGDLERIENANKKMGFMLFEDFHSGALQTSPLFGGELVSDNSLFSPVFLNRSARNKEINSKRKAALGDNVPAYERRGDTVFITFDAFSLNNFQNLYAEGYELSPDTGDTIELFAYALRRLQNEDSDAENVVIDISCNGGGIAISAAYVLKAIIGKCIICLQNPNTAALSQYDYDFDLNLDGVIDENDISMKEMGKNIAVIISDCSFSCGNLVPCALDALDDSVLLLGQQSGGGSCVVGYTTTAIGSMMQMSGDEMLCTMKNGYIRDIDGGVAPDVFLTTNRMFDRDYIVDVVNTQFG